MLKFRHILTKCVNLLLCVAILSNTFFINRIYAEENGLYQDDISQNDTNNEMTEEGEDSSFYPENEEEPSNTDDFVVPPLTYNAPVFDESINFVHVKKNNGLLRAAPTTIPSSYDSRNVNGKNYITPVKDQNPFGTCWIFATTAAMEANYLRKHSDVDTIDLSEYKMAWFSYDSYGYSDPLGLMKNDGIEFMIAPSTGPFSFGTAVRAHGIDTFNAGGNAVNITNMISSGIGICDEVEGRKYTDIEVGNFGVITNPDRYKEGGAFSFSGDECYDHDYILVNSNVYEFSSTAYNNTIKQAIMDNGAVCVSMFYDGDATSGTTGTCFNSTNYSYYCPFSDHSTNHLVTMVGWDDNFDKNKFNQISYKGVNYKPNNNGAWLIKNSWGTSWGNQGYFWISYEDASIHLDKVYSFEIEKENKTNPYKIYCTDGYIDSRSVPLTFANTEEGQLNYAAEYFEPQADETIEKIGIYSTDADLKYTISIYTDILSYISFGAQIPNCPITYPGNSPTISDINTPNVFYLVNYPNVFLPTVEFTTTIDYYGYHLVDVPDGLKVKKDEPYLIVITSTSEDGKRSGFFYAQGDLYVNDSFGQDFKTGDKYSCRVDNESKKNWLVGVKYATGEIMMQLNTDSQLQGIGLNKDIYLAKYDLKLKVLTKEASTTASYKVEHYTENLTGGGYTKQSEQSFTGTIGSNVTASAIQIDGFDYDSSNANNVKSGTVVENGSLVLKLYYKRHSYKITFDTAGGSSIAEASYKYGATITPPANPTKTGYTFSKWDPALPSTMPSKDITVKAIWAPANVNVHILHYLQNGDGNTFSFDSEDTVSLPTDSSVTLSSKTKTSGTYQYYEYQGGVCFTAKPDELINLPSNFETTTTVLPGGNRYIVLIYIHRKYTLTLEKDNGINEIKVNSANNLSQYMYDQSITLLATTKPGYKFSKWTKNGSDFTNNTSASYSFNMPGEDVTYKAYSTPIKYKITYELGGGAFPASQQAPTEVNYDSEFTVPVPEKDGFDFTGWDISGLDSTTHIIGGTETTSTSLTGSTATTFKNLTTVENNIITFKANYGPKQYQYTVQKYLMDISGNYPGTPTSTDSGSGEFESSIDYSSYTVPEGFSLDSTKSVRPEKITGPGVVAKLYYSRNKYQLSISKAGDNNQTISGDGEYYYEQTVNISVTPSIGYHFVSLKEGSNVLSTNSTYSFTMPAKAYSLTSSCEKNTYTIKYDLNYSGASNPNNSIVEYGSEKEISNPTRQYYTFTGWDISGLDSTTHIIDGIETTSTALTGSTATKFKNLTAVNGATITFKATWSANTINYTVNIYTMKVDGTYPSAPTSTVSPSPSAVYGSNISYTPTQEEGFSVDDNQSVLTGVLNSDSVILKVYYKRNTHTITINSDNGVASVTGAGEHLYGSSVNLQATIKSGYKFNKWVVGGVDNTSPTPTIEMPNSDVTIQALTTPIKYKITYELGGGAFQASQQALTEVNYDSEFTVPVPEKDGFDFTGWDISGLDSTTHIIDDIETTSTALTGSTATTFKNLTTVENNTITFKANWSSLPVSYIIKYFVQDISGNYVSDSEPYLTEEKEVPRGEVVSITPKEIDGFTFDSEKTGDNLSKTIDNEGIEFNIYYSRNKYKVILEKDDGIETVTGACEDYFDKEIDILCLANKGYSFLKWLRGDEDFSYDNSTSIRILAHDTTYKAISKANTYNITYDLDGGEQGVNSPSFATFNSDLIVPHPIKPGYDFIGWYVTGMEGSLTHYLNNDEYDGTDYIEGDPIIGDTNTIFKNLHSELDAEVTLKANWQARSDTPYTIEHYLELNDGSYDTSPIKSESKTGTTDIETSATSLNFTGYVYDSSSTSTGTIKGDGSLKIKLYYKRKNYKVVFDGNGSDSGSVGDVYTYFNSGISMPVNKFVKNNCSFVGWQVEDDAENIKCVGDNQYIINEAFINKYSIDDTITVKAVWDSISITPISVPAPIVSGEVTNVTNTSGNLYKATLTNDNIKEVLYPSSSSSSTHSAVTWVEALACSQDKVLQLSSALRSKGVNYKNIYCMDLNLFMADDADSTSGKKVSTTYSPVKLKLDISSYSELIESAKSDLVVVYSIHDGQLQDEIKGTFNKDTNEYSFSTSKFSTYALCVLQPATPSSNPGSDNYQIKPDFTVPNTGIK